jgi:hypothetical protein
MVVNEILMFFSSFLKASLMTRDFPHPSDPTTKKGDPSSIQGSKIDNVFSNILVEIAMGSLMRSVSKHS